MAGRIIRDYRYEPEKALTNREAIIAAARGRGRVIGTNLGVVIQPYYPRDPIESGDPFSPAGTQIAFDELDDALQALVLAGASSGVRVRELDGSPDVNPVNDIRVPNGTIALVAGSQVQLVFADYVGSFDLTVPGPGTGDIPNGRWAWWFDTTNNRQFLVRNRSGVLYYVELTS